MVQPINGQIWLLERNPYFWTVDTAGNQLPYIDKVQLTLAENPEVINLRAIAGEYDYMERFIDLAKLPVFLENAAARQIQGPSRSRLQRLGFRAEVQLRLSRSTPKSRNGSPTSISAARWRSASTASRSTRPSSSVSASTGTPIPADIIAESPGKE